MFPFEIELDTALFSLFDIRIEAFRVSSGEMVSLTGAMPSFRCLPKRNIWPIPRNSPGFLTRLFLPSFNELWNGPFRFMNPSLFSAAVVAFSSRSQCLRDAKNRIKFQIISMINLFNIF